MPIRIIRGFIACPFFLPIGPLPTVFPPPTSESYPNSQPQRTIPPTLQAALWSIPQIWGEQNQNKVLFAPFYFSLLPLIGEGMTAVGPASSVRKANAPL